MDKNKERLKVGDILFNPFACDYWIVSERYSQEKAKTELYIKLIHDDCDEDITIAKSFFKVGNIYEPFQ